MPHLAACADSSRTNPLRDPEWSVGLVETHVRIRFVGKDSSPGARARPGLARGLNEACGFGVPRSPNDEDAELTVDALIHRSA